MDDDPVWCSTSGLANGLRTFVQLTDEGLHVRTENEPEGGGELIRLGRIGGVTEQVGAWTGYVTIEIDGAALTLARVPKREALALVEALRAQLRHRPAEPEPEAEPDVPPDGSALAELERLGRLRASGVLTEAEFEIAKATFLKRL